MYLKILFISSLIHSWNNGHPSHMPAESNHLFNPDDFYVCPVQVEGGGRWDLLAAQLSGSTNAAVWLWGDNHYQRER